MRRDKCWSGEEEEGQKEKDGARYEEAEAGKVKARGRGC